MECYLEKKSSNAKMKKLMKNRKRVALIKNLMAEYQGKRMTFSK